MSKPAKNLADAAVALDPTETADTVATISTQIVTSHADAAVVVTEKIKKSASNIKQTVDMVKEGGDAFAFTALGLGVFGLLIAGAGAASKPATTVKTEVVK